MIEQLAFPTVEAPLLALDALLVAARSALDLDRHPGFAAFTSGAVTAEQDDDGRIILTTDNRWAASAIRTALWDAGHAVEGDPGCEAITVTAWPISQAAGGPEPGLVMVEQFDKYERSVFLLNGPHGAVEQRCGHGGHNDLLVHAQHPFPRGARGTCELHGAGCWRRSSWPLEARIRRMFRSVVTATGSEWQAGPEAEQTMRALYVQYVHATRPGDEPPAFRFPAGTPQALPVRAREARPEPSTQAPARPPRLVDVITDLAEYADSPA